LNRGLRLIANSVGLNNEFMKE